MLGHDRTESAVTVLRNTHETINGLHKAITSAAPKTKFGAYLNYVDPSLDAKTAHELYYGEELYKRILKVKNDVDPNKVFWNPQAIGN
jgi:FAD/FMN-containing dehydrogenase